MQQRPIGRADQQRRINRGGGDRFRNVVARRREQDGLHEGGADLRSPQTGQEVRDPKIRNIRGLL